MAGIHEKMQTDYIWIKDHSSADDAAKTRFFFTFSIF